MCVRSWCGTRPAMPLPPPRHWDWWTTRPPCGNSNGTSSSSGTLAARSSTTQRQPLRSLRCMHRSALRAAFCARIAATGVRVGRVERAGSTCTSSASGTPTTCSLSWAWWGGRRRSWRRSLCHPYPWDQCERWWNNRVGWIPNCEDAAHPPPPPKSGTVLHNTSCVSYALRAYSTRCSPCVPGATPIRSVRSGRFARRRTFF